MRNPFRRKPKKLRYPNGIPAVSKFPTPAEMELIEDEGWVLAGLDKDGNPIWLQAFDPDEWFGTDPGPWMRRITDPDYE
jgi:hypothetical protein